ncbi:hypothetical protein ACFZBU_40475 [Embleya sp. NPDC008237]|uniref:hypothetical protein n=1 Tax=Embleya sp. NPDC008237 TaxID=3363978 RepID=UPI0036E56C90
MPQDIEGVRGRNLAWARRVGLVRGERARHWYTAWRGRSRGGRRGPRTSGSWRLSRDEAVAAACEEVRVRCERFRRPADAIPETCALLGLPAGQRAAVDAYIEVMTAWMTGHHAWQAGTRRYLDAPTTVPDTGPDHPENVLGT